LAASKDYLEYILDVLSLCDNITAKRLFGGYGLYQNGIIFAIIVENELYFKVDESNIDLYQNLNSEPLTFHAKGKTISMSYRKVPDEIIENKELLVTHVELAVLASAKNKKHKKARKNLNIP